MNTELIKQLLEAGAHFGHSRSRWNPKMSRFIFGERSKIYIIDLEKTAEALDKAKEFLKQIAAKGKIILFVGTKKQAQDAIVEAAERTGMWFVKDRWLGGTLTNFKTIRNSIKRLKEIEAMKKDGTFEAITKKEKAIYNKELDKLKKNLQGIVNMNRMPDAIFVVDAKKEAIAIKEARKLSIPVVAIVDTNVDPDPIDYPIPANDDAMRSIKLIINLLCEGIMEGQKEFTQAEVDRKKDEVEDKDLLEEVVLSEDAEKLAAQVNIDKGTKKEKKPLIVKKKERGF